MHHPASPQENPTTSEQLAAGYSGAFRVVEVVSIAVFFALFIAHVAHLQPLIARFPMLGASAILLGWVAADFVTGLVHWAGDTWGTPDWPVVGAAFIRPFREHHVDEKAITRHDFIEVNGANCLVSLPILGAAFAIPFADGKFALFALTALVSLVFWVFATNQIHKWAHQDQPLPIVRALQRLGLVLSPENHSRHHHSPYDRYYCITTGWLNAPLAALGFYRKTESLITFVTGALARESDVELTAPAVPMAVADEKVG